MAQGGSGRLAAGVAWLALSLTFAAGPAAAQRTQENAVASAEDAFGSSVGQERTGIYNDSDIRGFSPLRAGNLRIEGVYFDQQAPLSARFKAGFAIRVGVAALDYPFPAPTGIVDYRIRRAGDERVDSLTLTRTAFGGVIYEVDSVFPVIRERLGVAAGFGFVHEEAVDGGGLENTAFGVTPRVRFQRGEVIPFVSYYQTRKAKSRIVVAAPGPSVPEMPEQRRYFGQEWAESESDNTNFGLLSRFTFGDAWAVRGGAIQSSVRRLRNFSEIFIIATPDGSGSHRVIADPEQLTRSRSGEAQVTWNRRGRRLRHRVLFTVRGRDKLVETGGSDVRDLGPIRLGSYDPEPEPKFRFGPVDSSDVRQITGAVGYVGRLGEVLRLNLGLQKTSYRASFTARGSSTTRSDSPWFYNATLALTPRRGVTAYAGAVRGLEESGAAPENAANRNEQLPATHTRQLEGGVRLELGSGRLVASVFEITKPYFSFDAADRFSELGEVRHRGVEASFTGDLGRLHLLAGAVLMDPVVTGEARALGLVGKRPVGTTPILVRLDAEYRTTLQGLSLSGSVVHNGRRTASARTYPELGGRQLTLPELTTVELAARYRFRVASVPVSARLVASNIFDERAWKIVAANSYQLSESRRVAVYLMADF